MDQTDLWRQSSSLQQGAEVFALLGLAAVIVLPMIMAVLDLSRLDHPFRRGLALALIITAVVAFIVVDSQIQDARVTVLEGLRSGQKCDRIVMTSAENGIFVTQDIGMIADLAFMFVGVFAGFRVFARSEDRLSIGR
jgi:uncharacterized membrane protein YjgN (DUF898 family)